MTDCHQLSGGMAKGGRTNWAGPSSQSGTGGMALLPAPVRKCHTECMDRPVKVRAEAAKRGPGRAQEPRDRSQIGRRERTQEERGAVGRSEQN